MDGPSESRSRGKTESPFPASRAARSPHLPSAQSPGDPASLSETGRGPPLSGTAVSCTLFSPMSPFAPCSGGTRGAPSAHRRPRPLVSEWVWAPGHPPGQRRVGGLFLEGGQTFVWRGDAQGDTCCGLGPHAAATPGLRSGLLTTGRRDRGTVVHEEAPCPARPPHRLTPNSQLWVPFPEGNSWPLGDGRPGVALSLLGGDVDLSF